VNANRDGDEQDIPEPEQRIADALTRTDHTAAAAESLTGGNVSAELSAIEGASNWFLGAVVAYAEKVKFDLLDVPPGPVITADCAQQMAVGVARLLGADFAVATTGVGGPGPQEGLPQGTVFIAVATPDGSRSRQYSFDGEPAQVVQDCTRRALHDLAAEIDAFLVSEHI
jgi:nicotinamide-nucleotide amidase